MIELAVHCIHQSASVHVEKVQLFTKNCLLSLPLGVALSKRVLPKIQGWRLSLRLFSKISQPMDYSITMYMRDGRMTFWEMLSWFPARCFPFESSLLSSNVLQLICDHTSDFHRCADFPLQIKMKLASMGLCIKAGTKYHHASPVSILV